MLVVSEEGTALWTVTSTVTVQLQRVPPTFSVCLPPFAGAWLGLADASVFLMFLSS
jgi:hypothetical protein